MSAFAPFVLPFRFPFSFPFPSIGIWILSPIPLYTWDISGIFDDVSVENLVASAYDTTTNFFDPISILAKAIAFFFLVLNNITVPYLVVRDLNNYHKKRKLEAKECIVKYSYFYSEYKDKW